MMISKGQLINDRYEIIRSIGEGGMANVYLANDTILDRLVAVKVLRGDLSEDEKFVRRFQREAIAASSLNHPNIVEVYDVGEDNGKYYIVMEYVDGKTLKSLIKKRGALTLPEVVDIMLQLASAISCAHDSYIIHRDIKPQNVIILEDGRVKVMDFGIAAQLNSNDLTQTNSVMGTVYYLPPEQANGNVTTTKSDIYSLGILMYELVVGRVPFKGDSPVEVAIKQMRERIPSLTDANPDIPQSIENVILRACAKNPKNRYESMGEMRADLETVLDKNRFDEAKVVYEYPESNFDDSEKHLEKRSDRNKKNEEGKKYKKLNKSVIIASVIAGVLLFTLLFTFIIYPKFISKPSVEVPDVSNLKVSKAEKLLEDSGFVVNVKTKKKTSDEIDKGKVIETDPEAGRTIKKGSKITLIVSSGSKKIEIEDYTGKNYYEIKAKLEAANITVEIEKKDVPEGDNVKDDIILGQDVKAGEKLGKGDTIILTIPNVYVVYPDFAKEGYSELDVKNFCAKNGLTLEINHQADGGKSDGTIIYQNMAAGTKVRDGATVKITVVKNEVKPGTDMGTDSGSNDEGQ
ncbi:MAG: Stk1 family PASTA domain-containing Ser/Thr kinase [Bacilli bacterium]|nr:Stk1 family PASTA domain-containing Ser/Thr kinase [Bacilli bacterium]